MTSPYAPENPFAPRQRTYAPENPFAQRREEEEEERGLLGRIAGAASTTLGPLFRTAVEGMAFAGPTGAAPSRGGPSPRERMEEVERLNLEEERKLGRDYPLTSLGLGLGGAVTRYGIATALGGPFAAGALGAAESAASRPEESLAGLAATGAGALDMPEAQRRLQNIAESPVGRTVTDIVGGEAIGRTVGGAIQLGRRLRRPPPSAEQQLTANLAAVRSTRGEPAASPLSRNLLPAPKTPVRDMTPEQELTAGLGAVRSARGEPLASQLPPRGLPAPAYPLPEEFPRALPAPKFPPESPRFRTRTVAEERAALAEQQLRDARNLDEAIAARQQAWEAEQAARVRALEEEPSRFPGSPSFRPPTPPPTVRGLREALEERQSQLARIGQAREARELKVRIDFLDEMRRPWDELTPEQQRQFETFMTYAESRKAQGLVSGVSEGGPALLKVRTRELRQLAAMEAWYKMPEASRTQFVEALQRESQAARLGEMETMWRRALAELQQTPLDQIVIINPQTGREVTVAAALKRTKNHPARFEAEAFLDEMDAALREINEGIVSGRGRSPALPSRFGEVPTAAKAAEMPPVAAPLAERQAERAAGAAGRRRSEQELMRLRNRLGAADPALMTEFARVLGGAAVGGVVGATAAETPEERNRFILGGALTGAGLTGAGRLASRAAGSEQFNEALESIVERAGKKSAAAPTATPFRATPETVEGVTISGVKRGMPTPPALDASKAGRPLSPAAEAIVDEDRKLLMRLNLAPDLQDRLAPRIAEIRATAGQARTWQEESREAARLLNTQRGNLAQIAPKNMTGAQGLAIASLVRENTEVISRNLDALRALDPTDVNGKLALQDQIDDLDKQNVALLSTIMAGRREQGRALNANKILANLTSDPTYWLLKAERVKGADMLTQEQRIEITNLLNKGEAGREQLLQYIASLRKTSWLGQGAQLRRAGLLTALAGRIRDVISTGDNVLVRPILRVPGAATDALAARYIAGKLGGPAAQYRAMTTPRLQEFRAMAKGAKEGMQQAVESLGLEYVRRGDFKNLGEFIRAAQLDPDLLRRMDIPQQINIDSFFPGTKANLFADFYQKYVMRFSGASDRIFRGAAYRGALDEGARVQAVREGLSGAALEKRVKQLLTAPPDDLVADAVLQSEYATFVNDGSLSRGVSAVMGILSTEAEKGIKAGAEVEAALNTIFPFRRTPANLMTRIAEATPGLGAAMFAKRASNWLGAISKAALESNQSPELLRAVRQEQRRMIETLTLQGTGIGLLALGFYLYDQGVLSGDLPDDAAGREQWALEGKKPNSILINGQWFPIGQIAPYGNIVSMAASMKQSAEREGESGDLGDMLSRAPMAAVRGVLNQPMVTGPKEMLEAATGGAREQERYKRSLAGSFVPSGLAQAARADEVVREPQTIVEAIQSRIPGAARGVPARLNIFGEPMRSASTIGLMYDDLRRADRTVAEMARVGAEVGPIQKWRNEPFDQYQMRQRDAGQRTRVALNQLFSSAYYLSASEKDKRDMIAKEVERSRATSTRALQARGIREPERRR